MQPHRCQASHTPFLRLGLSPRLYGKNALLKMPGRPVLHRRTTVAFASHYVQTVVAQMIPACRPRDEIA